MNFYQNTKFLAIVAVLLLCYLLKSGLVAQVYPYEYSPVTGSSEGKLCGLVSSNNEKITEPIYPVIEPFLNPAYNDYTVYRYKVDNPPGSKHPYYMALGLIHKSGTIIPELQGLKFTYNGNGRLVYFTKDSVLTIFNLKTKKSFSRSPGERVRYIAHGKTYYVILAHEEEKTYTLLDEHGQPWPVHTAAKERIEFVRRLNDAPVFSVSGYQAKKIFYTAEGKVLEPEEIWNEDNDAVGIDQSMLSVSEEQMQQQKSEESSQLNTQAKEKLGSKYPGFKIIHGIYDQFDDLKFFEIENQYGSKGLVDQEGNIILGCEYTQFTPLYTDFNDDGIDDAFFLEIKKHSNSGLLNMKGELLLKPRFGFLEFRKDVNLIWLIGPNGYSGYCDENGNLFLPKECECLD
jgi:hypothetical protein